jgi:hypothetical protein
MAEIPGRVVCDWLLLLINLSVAPSMTRLMLVSAESVDGVGEDISIGRTTSEHGAALFLDGELMNGVSKICDLRKGICSACENRRRRDRALVNLLGIRGWRI